MHFVIWNTYRSLIGPSATADCLCRVLAFPGFQLLPPSPDCNRNQSVTIDQYNHKHHGRLRVLMNQSSAGCILTMMTKFPTPNPKGESSSPVILGIVSGLRINNKFGGKPPGDATNILLTRRQRYPTTTLPGAACHSQATFSSKTATKRKGRRSMFRILRTSSVVPAAAGWRRARPRVPLVRALAHAAERARAVWGREAAPTIAPWRRAQAENRVSLWIVDELRPNQKTSNKMRGHAGKPTKNTRNRSTRWRTCARS